MSETYTAKSGNVAVLTIKGARGQFRSWDVSWYRAPSKRDVRECNSWFMANHQEVEGLASAVIEDPDVRQAVIDDFLYGGQRN